MSNHWRRRDRDGGKQFNRRRKKADQFSKHKEDDRDDATFDRKRHRRDKVMTRRFRETPWEDETMEDAGDGQEVTGEQESAGLSEHPGDD